MNDFGYAPGTLMGNGVLWEEKQILCELDGQVRSSTQAVFRHSNLIPPVALRCCPC